MLNVPFFPGSGLGRTADAVIVWLCNIYKYIYIYIYVELICYHLLWGKGISSNNTCISQDFLWRNNTDKVFKGYDCIYKC